MIDFLLGVPGKLATIYTHLTTYLSSTRCAKIDNLDAAITTRAAASTALSTATWTGTRAGYIDFLNTGVPAIKNVQTGYVSGSASAGVDEDTRYIDVTISAAVVAKSLVIVQPGTDGTAYDTPLIHTGRLTSTTNLRLSKATSGTITMRGRWYVIEFN
jgi:hypothetical protein